MNNNKPVEKTITEWSVNVPEENSTPKVLTAVEKMLRTSRLYLKVGQTKTESDLKRQAKIVHSQESPVGQ